MDGWVRLIGCFLSCSRVFIFFCKNYHTTVNADFLQKLNEQLSKRGDPYWGTIQARYGCEKLFLTSALTKSDVASALRIWIEVGEALNWRGCRMSRNAWGSPPMWATHRSLFTENCELLFSSGMRNPCVTFAGPFILFWLVSVQLSACEPSDWGLLACVHVDCLRMMTC